MKSILLSLCLAIVCQLNAQQFSSANPDYIKNVKAGEQMLLSENYDSCLVYYKRGFEIKQTSVLSTLRAAACAYSLEEKAYLDMQMTKAFELDWGNAKNIFYNYSEFTYLHDTPFNEDLDKRWTNAANDAGINIPLMEELEAIKVEDQVYRKQMSEMYKANQEDSPAMDSLGALQHYADSVNIMRIEEIIAEYGYPGKSMVGGQASAAFLVIQHADLEIQEKYVDLLIEAADAEELRWSSVALLVDRINVRNDRPQKYGTQLGKDKETSEFYFSEIEQPFKIDSVRATVGLPPIQQYADNWSYTWDPQIHLEKAKIRKEKKAAEEMKKE